MATVKRKSMPQSGWATWFNGLNCSLISASGDVVTIDNKFTITKEAYLITCKQDGTTLFTMNCNNPVVVTVCCSDTLFYIQQYDPQNRRSFFVYEKLPDKNIMGYYSSGNSTGIAFRSITTLTLTDLSTGMQYTHGARLNFSEQTGYISFAEDVLFNSGIKDSNDQNFIACSSVTADRVLTFHLNKFYSVGANTLVLMDSDSEV